MLAIIISSLVIMLASLVGVIFTWNIFGKFIKENIGLLVSFSAGVFLILVINLGTEVFEHAQTLAEPLLWIAAGIAGILLLFRLLPNFHHHHSDAHEDHQHSLIDVRKIIISDSIHNIGDGVLLAASFAISIHIGIAATISIFIHEIVQEISEFFVMRQSGMSTGKALLVNLASSSTILIGAIGGFFLLDTFEAIELPLLGLSAGAFLVVVFQDLIPESVRHSHKEKKYIQHLIFFAIGCSLMLFVGLFVSHNHDHEDDHHHDESEHTTSHEHDESEHEDVHLILEEHSDHTDHDDHDHAHE